MAKKNVHRNDGVEQNRNMQKKKRKTADEFCDQSALGGLHTLGSAGSNQDRLPGGGGTLWRKRKGLEG